MYRGIRKRKMSSLQITKFITLLKNNCTSIKQSRRRESGVVITPKLLLMILCGMIVWYATILMIGNEKDVEKANSGLQFLFYVIVVLFGGLSLVLISIFIYDKISTMRNKVKEIIKSPDSIKQLEQELQTIEDPKTRLLTIISTLNELLRRVRELEKEKPNSKLEDRSRNELEKIICNEVKRILNPANTGYQQHDDIIKQQQDTIDDLSAMIIDLKKRVFQLERK